jgi:acetyltransferase
VAPTALAAAAGAAIVGFPVVLKIVSPQITHKSDVGGVVLNLESGTEVAASASAMLERVAQRVPGAEVTGFALQPMIKRAQALELIAGTHVDPLFGPVILFGAGGTRVEVVADSAIALPPLNEPLARALVARTRVAKLLAGWRDVPPANAAALHGVLIALSQLLADEPRIAELDINPLLADSDGVIALDARVRVDAAAPGGAARFAVRPYPAELVEQWTWQPRESEARELTLRPIRPEDEAQHLEFLERVSPEDIRMRIFYSRRSIERTELARLTQIDYEREMAFIATAPRLEPTGDGASADAAEGSTEGTLEGDETLAVVRAITDPDNHDAEFGILVRSDLKGGGLGRKLMDKLIEYLKGRRTQRLVCTVLRENERMLELTAALGMIEDAEQPEPGTVRLSMPLL